MRMSQISQLVSRRANAPWPERSRRSISSKIFSRLVYDQEKLSRYPDEWQPDYRHLARVGTPRISRHPYHSPQQELWQAGEVEWFVIIRNTPRKGSGERMLK